MLACVVLAVTVATCAVFLACTRQSTTRSRSNLHVLAAAVALPMVAAVA